MTTTMKQVEARRRADARIDAEASALAERLMLLLERLDAIHSELQQPPAIQDGAPPHPGPS